MKTDYLKFVQWSNADKLFIGYCPDLFIGGVCHGNDEQKVYRELTRLVTQEIAKRMQELLLKFISELMSRFPPMPPVAQQVIEFINVGEGVLALEWLAEHYCDFEIRLPIADVEQLVQFAKDYGLKEIYISAIEELKNGGEAGASTLQ